MSDHSVVIVAAKRTPTGAFQGMLAPYKVTDLGAAAIQATLMETGLHTELVEEVIMGCVLSAGVGQNPGRQAALKSGLLKSINGMTVNKVCGSGLQSVMLGHDHIKAGTAEIVIAGGMESMTNAPYLMPEARKGYRMGPKEVLDHMIYDGLQDAYSGQSMGLYGEETALKYGFTRQDQDAFAISSANRAIEAGAKGLFKNEITPLEQTDGSHMNQDEPPTKVKLEKIPQLKPAFKKDGTLTAANSSSISDGAAAVMLMTEKKAKDLGLTPLARIVAHATYSHEPEWFTTAPIGAVKKLLTKTGWDVEHVDLFEINEAFAVVTMAAMEELKLPEDKVNIHGGACALGHPIGASGSRILVTLVHALEHLHKKRGIATLCIGGGEAVAMAVERF